MKTTRKQLVGFAISIIKELQKTSNQHRVNYDNKSIFVWFHNQKTTFIILSVGHPLRENKARYKEVLKRIRGASDAV